MKFETIKSIVLTMLVILSVVFTWGLWTFQPQSEYVQNAKLARDFTIGVKRDLFDVVKPTQIIFYDRDEKYGTTNIAEINEVYKEVAHFNFSHFKEIQAPNRIEGNYVEIIFPKPIPKEVISEIFKIKKDDLKIANVSRIIIPVELNRVNFISDDKRKALQARIDLDSIKEFKTKFFDEREQFSKYYQYQISGSKHIYLPKESVMMDEMTYSIQILTATQFKNALFDNPLLVKQYNTFNNGDESYSDGLKELEVTNNKRKLKYVNPTSELYSMDPAKVLRSSFNFMNQHAAWTDSYYFFDQNEKKQSIDYRLFVEGTPVFDVTSKHKLELIQLTLKNNEVSNYSRSLINLRFSLKNERRLMKLPSGEMLIQHISKSIPDYNPKKLENAVLGYELKTNQLNAIVINFEPKWFILYDGVWQKVEIPLQGGME